MPSDDVVTVEAGRAMIHGLPAGGDRGSESRSPMEIASGVPDVGVRGGGDLSRPEMAQVKPQRCGNPAKPRLVDVGFVLDLCDFG